MAKTRDWFDGSIVAAANTLSALKALTMTGYASGNLFMLRGHTALGDGGHGIFRLVTSSPGTANDGTIIASSTSNYWFVRLFEGPVNVRWFGAAGANSDYTTAIEAAFAYCVTQVANPSDYTIEPQGVATAQLYFPAGRYTYSGSGAVFGSNLALSIIGDGHENTRITLGATSWLLAETSRILSLKMSGISVMGGKGAVKQTLTTENVSGTTRVIEDCRFYDMSEYAFASLSSDNPYWSFVRTWFFACNALVHSGLADNVEFRSCQLNNYQTYAVKLCGTTAGNNAIFDNCFFAPFVSGTGRTAVWVVPGSNESLSVGLRFIACKFGNEGMDSSDRFVLLADEGSGTNSIDKAHATTVSTGWVGIELLHCAFYNISPTTVPAIYSYTPNTKVVWNSYMDGGQVMELASVAQVRGSTPRLSQLNIFDLSQHYSQVNARATLGTAAAGRYLDPHALFAGETQVPNYWAAGDAVAGTQYVTTTCNGGAGWHATSASAASAYDARGGTDAVEITLSGSGGLYIYAIGSTIPVNTAAWIEFDMLAGSSVSVDDLTVALFNVNGSVVCEQRIYRLTSGWARVRIPFVIRAHTAADEFVQLSFGSATYSAGTKTKFRIGGVLVYTAKEPVNRLAHLKGSATWNPPSIATGTASGVDVTVVGARSGDEFGASFSLDVQDMAITAAYKSDDTVRVTLTNGVGGGAINLAEGTVTAFGRKNI